MKHNLPRHEKETLVVYKRVKDPNFKPDIDSYIAAGGYETLKRVLKEGNPAGLCAEVEKAVIKGRGGAGFPAGMKWKFLDRKSGKPIYFVVNADESEPGTHKDRWVIYFDPHQLIEGLVVCSYATQSKQAFIFIRGEFVHGAQILEHAIEEARAKGFVGENILGSGFSLEIVVHRGAGAYVCGEETGLLEALEGKRGQPRIKPPYFPAVLGLYNCPTVVNNVETVCHCLNAIAMGGEAYAKLGAKGDSGTRILNVSGLVAKPGIFEIATGTVTLGELLYDMCGGPLPGRKFKAVIPGGSSMKPLRFDEKYKIKDADGNVKEVDLVDVPLDSASLMACGSSIGTGGVIVFDDSVEMIQALANLNAFYKHESCGQCTPCREGSVWMARITKRICDGNGAEEDIDTLKDVADTICGRTVCAHGEGEAWPVQGAIAKFRDEYVESIRRRNTGEPSPFTGYPLI